MLPSFSVSKNKRGEPVVKFNHMSELVEFCRFLSFTNYNGKEVRVVMSGRDLVDPNKPEHITDKRSYMDEVTKQVNSFGLEPFDVSTVNMEFSI